MLAITRHLTMKKKFLKFKSLTALKFFESICTWENLNWEKLNIFFKNSIKHWQDNFRIQPSVLLKIFLLIFSDKFSDYWKILENWTPTKKNPLTWMYWKKLRKIFRVAFSRKLRTTESLGEIQSDKIVKCCFPVVYKKFKIKNSSSLQNCENWVNNNCSIKEKL